MELGMIGLGKMGYGMTGRLLEAGHKVTVFDVDHDRVVAVRSQGATGAGSIDELVQKLAKPRIVWLMLPSGEPTETTISSLAQQLSAGDIVADGGNTYYRENILHAKSLAQRGIHLLDIGTSGGVLGSSTGYCLMVGGCAEAYNRIIPILDTLAARGGYLHVGPSGSGHFTKMVHNGIEYALMQAYAEGFELMSNKQEFQLDLAKIAAVWGHGSIIHSKLLDLIAVILAENGNLEKVGSWVEDSGEGRWLIKESLDLAVPLPAITNALQVRFRSRLEHPFGEKMLAALRKQFGGHSVRSD